MKKLVVMVAALLLVSCSGMGMQSGGGSGFMGSGSAAGPFYEPNLLYGNEYNTYPPYFSGGA